jgi:hypothetical protein
MALLLCGNSRGVAADEPAPAPVSIFAVARASIAAGRIDKGRVLGFHNDRRIFTELPASGGLLVGFDIGLGRFFDIECIYALRPVYLMESGETYIQDHGLFSDRYEGKKLIKSRVNRVERVRAKPGYAVGGITLRSGLNINGMALAYMRISGRGLDPQQAYSSPWICDRTGGSEAYMTGNGSAVVGLWGSEDVEHVHSLGLLTMRQTAGVVAAPLAVAAAKANGVEQEKPAEKKPAALQPPVPGKVPVVVPVEAPAPADEPAAKADEPVKEAAEPAAQVQETRSASSGMSWLPIAIFGIVTVPAFVFLLVSFNRKGSPPRRTRRSVDDDEDDDRPRRVRRSGNGIGPPPIPHSDPDDESEQGEAESSAAAPPSQIQSGPPPLPSTDEAATGTSPLPAWEQRPARRSARREKDDDSRDS